MLVSSSVLFFFFFFYKRKILITRKISQYITNEQNNILTDTPTYTHTYTCSCLRVEWQHVEIVRERPHGLLRRKGNRLPKGLRGRVHSGEENAGVEPL